MQLIEVRRYPGADADMTAGVSAPCASDAINSRKRGMQRMTIAPLRIASAAGYNKWDVDIAALTAGNEPARSKRA